MAHELPRGSAARTLHGGLPARAQGMPLPSGILARQPSTGLVDVPNGSLGHDGIVAHGSSPQGVE